MCKAAGPSTPLAGLASPSPPLTVTYHVPTAPCFCTLDIFCPQNSIFEYIYKFIYRHIFFKLFFLQLWIISELTSFFFFNSIITMDWGRILILNVSVENTKKCQLNNWMNYKNFSIKWTSFFYHNNKFHINFYCGSNKNNVTNDFM